jgi:hypothetical protein
MFPAKLKPLGDMSSKLELDQIVCGGKGASTFVQPGHRRRDHELFEEGIRGRFPRLRAAVSAKSAEQAFDIQTQYAKKAYGSYMAQMSKRGEMYVGLARSAYKPIEDAASKAAKNVF